MRQRVIPAVVATLLMFSASASHAALLELALIIDGSSSISGPRGNESGPDWGLQIGAYQNIFQNDFFTNIVSKGPYDQVAVAAYVFSSVAGSVPISDQDDNVLETVTFDIVVTSFLDWTVLNNDQEAADFGVLFGTLPQPGGKTNTSEAINIATSGGTAGCPGSEMFPQINPILDFCNVEEGEVAGILNNGIDGDALVIDISTDGEPTEPNSDGLDVDPTSPENILDRQLAYDEADAARAAGVTVNAIGVGDVDPDFLATLVAGDPDGFFVTAENFAEFETTLEDKLEVELGLAIIPIPGALPLFLSALGGLAFWRRRTT
ncbi:MAG: DUF1194 domain-containing protein [Chromatiales bacterium]|nr:MAG: DUF1194 domain-containing protein [Chromatiales bacterium]